MKRKLLVIYTGGTIGMVREYGSDYLKPFDFKNLLDNIPDIKLIEADIDFFEFANPIDSSDVSIADWIKISETIFDNYSKYDGFVVLHGTDTMSYSASAISYMQRGLKKPVVFTGSQLPIGELRTDAKENLITSLYYASLYEGNEAVVQEVVLYFEYKLYRANRTSKVSASHFDAFDSPNYPILGESGVQLLINKDLLLRTKEELVLDKAMSSRVEVFTFFPGKDLNLLEYIIENEAIDGIILQAFGSGNIPSGKEVERILTKGKNLGKELVVITQCLKGGVSIGKYENSLILDKLDIINGKDLTLESATTKLIWLLGKGLKGEKLKSMYESNIVGELTI